MPKKQEKLWIIEKIVQKRFVKNKTEYFVKWKDFPSSQNTWEPKTSFKDPSIILQYEAKNKNAKKLRTKVPVKPKAKVYRPLSFIKKRISQNPAPIQKSRRSKIVKLATKRANKKNTNAVKDLSIRVQPLSKENSAERTIDTIIGIEDGPLKLLSSSLKYNFLIKFIGIEQTELVSRTEANRLYPQEVIKFYERNMFWIDP